MWPCVSLTSALVLEFVLRVYHATKLYQTLLKKKKKSAKIKPKPSVSQ